MPAADFECDCCGETFELKSKNGGFSNKISDGAYSTMIDRITSAANPDLFCLEYSKEYKVKNLIIIPKFFLVPDIIEKRKPLSPNARRTGWVGCNILVGEIPVQGKIPIICNEEYVSPSDATSKYQQIKQLQTNSISNRGWLLDILNCINSIPADIFYLSDMYAFADALKEKHSTNNNIEAKIRQQLQILRDKGFLDFLGGGVYQKRSALHSAWKASE